MLNFFKSLCLLCLKTAQWGKFPLEKEQGRCIVDQEYFSFGLLRLLIESNISSSVKGWSLLLDTELWWKPTQPSKKVVKWKKYVSIRDPKQYFSITGQPRKGFGMNSATDPRVVSLIVRILWRITHHYVLCHPHTSNLWCRIETSVCLYYITMREKGKKVQVSFSHSFWLTSYSP